MSDSIQQRLSRLEDQAVRKIATNPAAQTAATMQFAMSDPLRWERCTALAEASRQAAERKRPIDFDQIHDELVKLTRNHLSTLTPSQVLHHRQELERMAETTGNKFDMIAAELAAVQLEAFTEGK